jgi:aspartate/methionine/tyrosine aminotransferase
MFNFYSRMQSIQSPIIPIVGSLIRNHPGTISLGQGVVSYPPPPNTFEQLSLFFAESQNHKYQAVHGIPSLLTVITKTLADDNHITINKSQRVFVTAGSNMGFINAVLAITNLGDEIILQTPYYFNHEMAIAMVGCHPILVPTDVNYQLQPDLIKAAITPKTKAVVTISPNNPTGMVYSEESLRTVNKICADHGIYHISDEAYQYFTYNEVKHFSPATIVHSEPHTISLFSLSKTYGFASWRIGYMLIPEHLFTSVEKIQDTNLICPPVICQYAAVAAMESGKNYFGEKINTLGKIREIVLNELDKISNFCQISNSQGAFYFFLKVDTKIPSMLLVERLIKEYGIAVIPGNAFGTSDGCYLRVAYGSLDQHTVIEGINRLITGLNNIQ